MERLPLAVLTTSYPLHPDSSSGIFVQRLVASLPAPIEASVVVPADTAAEWPEKMAGIHVQPFRYAPRAWRILAHEPGGVPVALKRHRRLYLLLPVFLLAMLLALLRVARHAAAIQANWVICGVVAGFVGKVLARPVVTTLRGEDVTRAQRSRLDRWLLNLCVRWSARVVGVSEAIVAWLRSEFPAQASKFLVIENGVHDALLAMPRPIRHAHQPVELITVGSLIPRKGVDQIIGALAQLPRDAEWRLTVVGAGPEEQALREQARAAGLSEQVRFLGALAPERVADELAMADLFVLASHAEGRPNAVLEAMAAALPVVATDIAGVNEIVQHERTGLLFHDSDGATFVAHLHRLMNDPTLRAQFGENGRRWLVERGLTWAGTGRRYAAVFNELLGRP